MNITLSYTIPSPTASCGYKTQYQRKGESSYTTVISSGGTSTISITSGNTGCYYGVVKSDCCTSESSGVEWGVNMYVPLTAVLSVTGSPAGSNYKLTVTCPYPTTYPVLLIGAFIETCLGVDTERPFIYTHPANSLSSVGNITTSLGSPIKSSCTSAGYSGLYIDKTITTYSYGGSIQQLDPIDTPGYCRPYWVTSGTTHIGDPLTFPSLTADSFTITSSGGGPTTGTLVLSWYHDVYGSGVAPYDSMTIRVMETITTSNILGESGPIDTSTSGMKYVSINLLEVVDTLASGAIFSIKTIKSDGSSYATYQIVLP